MIEEIDHIGVAVRDLEEALATYEGILGLEVVYPLYFTFKAIVNHKTQYARDTDIHQIANRKQRK